MQQMSTEDDRIDAALSGLEDHDTTHEWVGRILLVVVLIAAAGAAVWWFVLRRKGDNPPKPTTMTFDKNGVPCEWSNLYLTPLPSLLKPTATELEVYLGLPDPEFGVLRVATFNSDSTIGLGLYPDKQTALPNSAKIKIQLCTGAAGVIVTMQNLTLKHNSSQTDLPLTKNTPLSCGGPGGAAQYLRLITACDGRNLPDARITDEGMNNSWGVAIQQTTTEAVLSYRKTSLNPGDSPDVRFVKMPSKEWATLAFSIRSQLCAPAQPTIAPRKTVPPAIDYPGLMSLLGMSVSKARGKRLCPIDYRTPGGSYYPGRARERSNLVVYLSTADKFIATTGNRLTQVDDVEQASAFVLTYMYQPSSGVTTDGTGSCTGAWTLQAAGTSKFLCMVPSTVWSPSDLTLLLDKPGTDELDAELIEPHDAAFDVRFRIGLNFCKDISWNNVPAGSPTAGTIYNSFGDCVQNDTLQPDFAIVGTTCMTYDGFKCWGINTIPAYGLTRDMKLTPLKGPLSTLLRLRLHVVKNNIVIPVPKYTQTTDTCANV